MKEYIKTTISRNKLYERNYTRDSIEKIELKTIEKINRKTDRALIDILKMCIRDSVDSLIDKDSLAEYWIEQTSKEEVIDDLIRGNNIEELLGLIPETIYEDEYENYLYSEIDC